jgi:hypothetical protein
VFPEKPVTFAINPLQPMTVQSLIDKLAIQDPTLDVCINDADTSLLLAVQAVTTRTTENGSHVISLEGDYTIATDQAR